MSMRLVRYLAQCGVASRRGAAEVVQSGHVEVNGVVTTNVAQGIEPTDQVRVRGKVVKPPAEKLVIVLNKPAGVVCSRSDPHNPETVYDCLRPEQRQHVKPVGRLDKETTGLLLMTDDGDLAFRLTHPRYGVEKTYRVTLVGHISDEAVQALRRGVDLDDGPTAPARVRVLERDAQRSDIEMTIHEGRNRQVRRMCELVGHRIIVLSRIAYGPLTLGQLRPGESRLLTDGELASLRKSVKLPSG